MNPGRACMCSALAAVSLLVPLAPAGPDPLDDLVGDAMLRRTDVGVNGKISQGATLPDLISATITGWVPESGADPYDGVVDGSKFPDVLRIKLRFAGLLNPPGPLDPDGPGGIAYDPFRHGPSPVYGYLELDVDDDVDTGGEFHALAVSRYLANVGRFGRTPADVPVDRAVVRQGEIDADFASPPQFERSGADFTLALCGCWELTVVSESGDHDGVFDAGEQWIVNGRFFERAQAFAEFCVTSGPPGDGPSAIGHYDPLVDIRFTHNAFTDETTIELVFPVTAQGSVDLYGGGIQTPDFSFGGGNHFNIVEALAELTFWAPDAVGDADVLADGWDAVSPFNYIDPTAWRATAIFGTAYALQEPVARFAWTDTGFGDRMGDFNGDGRSDEADEDLLEHEIYTLDGGPDDADGGKNGAVEIPSFGSNFSAFDLDYSGVVDGQDLDLLNPCVADLAPPFGVLDFSDVLAYLCAFADMGEAADLAPPYGVLDFSDVLEYIKAFGGGCP